MKLVGSLETASSLKIYFSEHKQYFYNQFLKISFKLSRHITEYLFSGLPCEISDFALSILISKTLGGVALPHPSCVSPPLEQDKTTWFNKLRFGSVSGHLMPETINNAPSD